ncbi:hypothetical protein BGZ54_004648 [Gamsiella multidivaricata]|nr:hypothetical protein BGZ54_004648 [Gamsiella multidivaricata]
MDTLSNLIESTGVALSNAATLLTSPLRQQDQGLEFMRIDETGTGSTTKTTLDTDRRKSTVASTVPPEIIHLIVNYLDNRDLVKVLTLNWTWAHIVAAKLWQEVHFTSSANRVVFLITRSVPAPSALDYSIDARLTGAAGPSSGKEALINSTTSSNNIEDPAVNRVSSDQEQPTNTRRRNSYPWPTLLPYHSMVHSLHVSLSNPDMIQDLLNMIPCCTELQSFSLHSVIPTEDLLLRGVVASAYNDQFNPMGCDALPRALSSSPPTMTAAPHAIHTSASATSISSMASSTRSYASTYTTMSAPIPSYRHPHSHKNSLSLDPFNRTTTPRATLQEADDETIMASSSSQSGMLLSLLANSCPRLCKLWFSGFHPVSVLGAPMDLRPRPPKFDARGFFEHERKIPQIEREKQKMETHGLDVEPPVAEGSRADVLMAGKSKDWIDPAQLPPLPPIPPVPGINRAAAAAVPIVTNATRTIIPPAPVVSHHIQSKIHSIQFVNCTLPPQYLLTMIQYSLPQLTSLHLTQCWQAQPLNAMFLSTLGKICPGLKEITLHATQSHRGLVGSKDVLFLLKSLEDPEADEMKGRRTYENTMVGSLADFPLGTFSSGKHEYGRAASAASSLAPSISSITATVGSSSSVSPSNSSSGPLSALATLPSSASSNSDWNTSSGLNNMDHQYQQDLGSVAQETPPRSASALESISVWFTHSILDQAITAELASRERHPKLKRVDFGSESSFDVGAECIRQLSEQRPELIVCTWVGCGDTGDDRDD